MKTFKMDDIKNPSLSAAVLFFFIVSSAAPVYALQPIAPSAASSSTPTISLVQIQENEKKAGLRQRRKELALDLQTALRDARTDPVYQALRADYVRVIRPAHLRAIRQEARKTAGAVNIQVAEVRQLAKDHPEAAADFRNEEGQTLAEILSGAALLLARFVTQATRHAYREASFLRKEIRKQRAYMAGLNLLRSQAGVSGLSEEALGRLEEQFAALDAPDLVTLEEQPVPNPWEEKLRGLEASLNSFEEYVETFSRAARLREVDEKIAETEERIETLQLQFERAKAGFEKRVEDLNAEVEKKMAALDEIMEILEGADAESLPEEVLNDLEAFLASDLEFRDSVDEAAEKMTDYLRFFVWEVEMGLNQQQAYLRQLQEHRDKVEAGEETGPFPEPGFEPAVDAPAEPQSPLELIDARIAAAEGLAARMVEERIPLTADALQMKLEERLVRDHGSIRELTILKTDTIPYVSYPKGIEGVEDGVLTWTPTIVQAIGPQVRVAFEYQDETGKLYRGLAAMRYAPQAREWRIEQLPPQVEMPDFEPMQVFKIQYEWRRFYWNPITKDAYFFSPEDPFSVPIHWTGVEKVDASLPGNSPVYENLRRQGTSIIARPKDENGQKWFFFGEHRQVDPELKFRVDDGINVLYDENEKIVASILSDGGVMKSSRQGQYETRSIEYPDGKIVTVSINRDEKTAEVTDRQGKLNRYTHVEACWGSNTVPSPWCNFALDSSRREKTEILYRWQGPLSWSLLAGIPEEPDEKVEPLSKISVLFVNHHVNQTDASALINVTLSRKPQDEEIVKLSYRNTQNMMSHGDDFENGKAYYDEFQLPFQEIVMSSPDNSENYQTSLENLIRGFWPDPEGRGQYEFYVQVLDQSGKVLQTTATNRFVVNPPVQISLTDPLVIRTGYTDAVLRFSLWDLPQDAAVKVRYRGGNSRDYKEHSVPATQMTRNERKTTVETPLQNLEPNAAYEWQVLVYNAQGGLIWGGNSGVWSFKTQTTILQHAASSITATGVNIQATVADIPLIKTVKVKIAEVSEPQPGTKFYNNWREVAASITRSNGKITIQANASGLNPNTTYAYDIFAYDVDNPSTTTFPIDRPKDPVTFKTLVEEKKRQIELKPLEAKVTLVIEDDDSFPLHGQISYSLNVVVDRTQNQGDLFTQDGKTKVGTYQFYPIANTETQILKLLFTESVSKTTYDIIYLADKYSITYVGTHAFFLPEVIDPNAVFWAPLAKFFKDPSKVTTIEFQAISKLWSERGNGPTGLLTPSFKSTFLPVYLKRLITFMSIPDAKLQKEENAQNPLPLSGSFFYYYESVAPSNRMKVLDLLDQNWGLMSLENKRQLIAAMESGDTANLEKAVDLQMRYIEEVRKQTPHSKPTLSPKLIQNALSKYDLSSTTREKVIQHLFRLIQENHGSIGWSMDLLYNTLIKGTGITGDVARYHENIIQVVNWILDYALKTDHSWLAAKFFNQFWEYVNQVGREKLMAYVDTRIKKYISEYPAYIANSDMNQIEITDQVGFLMAALAWPIPSQKKADIERLLLEADFSKWNGQVIFHNLLTRHGATEGVFGFSAANEAKLIEKFVNVLLLKFQDRPLQNPKDYWYGDFDATLNVFVHYVKKSPNFKNLAPLFFTLLQRLNPKQTGESEADFAARFNEVKGLFQDYGVFLYDLNTATHTHKTIEYIKVIKYFVQTVGDWFDVVVLSMQESGAEAKIGVVQFNINTYAPVMFAKSLLHEGAHAIRLRYREATATWDFAAENWYYHWSLKDVPTQYSMFSIDEYLAEFSRYFLLDTKTWLKTAIQNFQEGHMGMLNMFLTIWHSLAQKGQYYSYQLDEKTGELKRQAISANWVASDDGTTGKVFEFALDGIKYCIIYENSKISKIEIV